MASLLVFNGAADPTAEDAAEIAEARAVFRHQSEALVRVSERIDREFCRALALIVSCTGRLVFSGMGKPGLVARRLAATFASTGQPAFFLHPGEALHGDLGAVTGDDVMICLSKSGEGEELVRILPWLSELGVKIIALTGAPQSTIGRSADVTLDVSVEREAGPFNLVPTTSVLAMSAMGDALALLAMKKRRFGAEDFARLHPGGQLGKRLSARVRDVMHTRDLPFISPKASMRECVMTMTRGRCGLSIALDDAGRLAGLVTDGDLRRALQRDANALETTVADIMTKSPVTIHEDASLADAEERMHRLRLKALIVLNSVGNVVGVVEVFDG